jgi:hypothetical protein
MDGETIDVSLNGMLVKMSGSALVPSDTAVRAAF